MERAPGVGQVAGQHAPQPDGHLRRACSAELLTLAMCVEQGLLHQVGGIEPGTGLPAQVHPRQQQQVRAKLLHCWPIGSRFAIHDRPLRM